MTFNIEGAIKSVQIELPVDVTVALHACDTATDDALARGIAWASDLILAAPCCRRDISVSYALLRRRAPTT